MEVLAIGLMLTAALVPLVIPLFRPPLLALRSASGSAARLRALEMRRDAIYGAIREAGFDLRTGKIDQGDYDQQVVLLKREAVGVVGEIEELKSNPPRGSKRIERAVADLREGKFSAPAVAPEEQLATNFCTQCGQQAAADDRFCSNCGTDLETVE